MKPEPPGFEASFGPYCQTGSVGGALVDCGECLAGHPKESGDAEILPTCYAEAGQA